MKTEGMQHQLEALRRMNGRATFALFMEQGTGKTWTLLADAERMYGAGKIDGIFVVAPKGVHVNWITREIPKHLDGAVIARAWKSGAGKRERANIEELLRPREDSAPVPLRVLAMNIEALLTKDGYEFAERFLNSTKSLFIVDESSRIKNPSAARTKLIMRLRGKAVAARISTGTPVANSPLDVFSQMEFLESGLLGTTSYRAFVAEYADLLPTSHPLLQNITRRNPRAARAQIIARNVDGTPRWRNLDKLNGMLEPHSYRILKENCLDLPEKIYKQQFFDLTAQQHKAYRFMKDELRIALGDQDQISVSALASLVKLQQITSGFVISPETGEPIYIADDNPRLAALFDLIEDVDGQFIVWARFREELRKIAESMNEMGISCVEYHGGVSAAERERAVDDFQSGAARVFIGQPQSGGIGLTLTAAETVIYYSNDFNLETRLQSEDRAHRIGTKRHVVYIDLIAQDTIDETIARSLQAKTNVAANVLGDLRK